MDKKWMSKEETDGFEKRIAEYFYGKKEEAPRERKMKIYTNAHGADSFDEALEFSVVGYKRVYYDNKLPRIFKKLLHKSIRSGRLYKRTGTPKLTVGIGWFKHKQVNKKRRKSHFSKMWVRNRFEKLWSRQNN